MSSRHVPTRRLKSGVLFSAPDDIRRVPHDESTRRARRSKLNNIQNIIPGVRGMRLGEEAALDASPAPAHEQSMAIFARFAGPSSYGSSNRPENLIASREQKETLCLPVLKVSLTAIVEGTLAHMTLKQSFHNPSQMIIKEARHTFPLYDGSVVTAFECTIGDERRLRGVVKPKEQARKEYNKAVHDQAQAAALLEEHTPEIFETSLGNIPSKATVEIKIVYVQELKVVMMEGEVSEGIALIIPTSIAPRYSDTHSAGTRPSDLPHDKLDIEILVLNDGRIDADGCLEESGHLVYYHGTKMIESPRPLNGEYPVNEYYLWEHHSESPVLKKDFVFVFPMQKGHEMQSRAILSPPDGSGFAAMMVSVRPNELFRNAILPQSFSGEILFLLDRSASMDDWVGNHEHSSDGSKFGFSRGTGDSGSRKIDVLREAMHLVLAGLPKTCSFNIISWGTETWALWEQSRQHSPDNLQQAKEYISEIEADMGGTDLLRALKSTVQRRLDDRKSTQIIVLTDGELDPEKPIDFIWRTRQKLQNKIRFFSLGIGGDVPRSLIESIAELGGGFGDVVDTVQNPRWHARLNRLTKSALEPDMWDCNIDIGDEFEQRSLMDYKLNSSTLGAHQVPYFQCPSAIAGLHPFRFTSIFFLIHVERSGVLPSQVTITTTTHGAKTKLYRLPVQPAVIQNGTMHQLVAKAVLVDLEDTVKRQPSSSRLAEENAQTIGTTYSITSKWSSFVAVPDDESTNTEGSMMEHYKRLMDGVDITELLNAESEYKSEHGLNNDDRVYLGKSSYMDHYRADVTEDLPTAVLATAVLSTAGFPAGDIVTGVLRAGASMLGGWLRARRESSRRENNLEPMLSAHREATNVQALAPPTAQDGKAGEPPAAEAGIRRSTNGLDSERIWEVSPNQEVTKAQSDDGSTHRYLLNSVDLFATLGAQLLSGFTSSDSDISGEESVTRNNPKAMDPLNWEVAVKYQNGQGLFELPKEARNILHLHFCPNTKFVLAVRLGKILHEEELEEMLCIQIIDTMIMVRCYQTHLALTEDIWDLMMERAQDAIAEVIGQDTLVLLEGILTDSMIHQHYKAATGEGEEDGELTGGATCPVCDIRWQASRVFLCPFDHRSGTPPPFKEWDDFWKHQQQYGHMVCPRAGTSA